MKILGLDFGLRRIGLALSDGEVVGSLPTMRADNRAEALQKISEICREEDVEKIIIGLPKSESGETEDIVRSFAQEVNKIITIPIEYVDETLTSKEAERLLSHSDLDPKSTKFKEEVDRVSAKLILEQYLKETKDNE